MDFIKLLFSGAMLMALLAAGAVSASSVGENNGVKQLDQRQAIKKVGQFYASQQGDAIALRWQAVKGDCDGYRIYHQAGDRLRQDSLWYDVDSSQTSNLFLDVTAGGKYTFRVAALYGRREGPLSSRVTVQMINGGKTSGPSDTAN